MSQNLCPYGTINTHALVSSLTQFESLPSSNYRRTEGFQYALRTKRKDTRSQCNSNPREHAHINPIVTWKCEIIMVGVYWEQKQRREEYSGQNASVGFVFLYLKNQGRKGLFRLWFLKFKGKELVLAQVYGGQWIAGKTESEKKVAYKSKEGEKREGERNHLS